VCSSPACKRTCPPSSVKRPSPTHLSSRWLDHSSPEVSRLKKGSTRWMSALLLPQPDRRRRLSGRATGAKSSGCRSALSIVQGASLVRGSRVISNACKSDMIGVSSVLRCSSRAAIPRPRDPVLGRHAAHLEPALGSRHVISCSLRCASIDRLARSMATRLRPGERPPATLKETAARRCAGGQPVAQPLPGLLHLLWCCVHGRALLLALCIQAAER